MGIETTLQKHPQLKGEPKEKEPTDEELAQDGVYVTEDEELGEVHIHKG